MKSLIIGFLSLLIALPATSFAIIAPPTTDDTPDGGGSSLYCPNLSQTLRRSMRDSSTVPAGQVSELQTFLADYFELNEDEVVSGFFGRLTQKYLTEFQQKTGLPAFGIAGTLTRAKIAEVCKSGSGVIGGGTDDYGGAQCKHWTDGRYCGTTCTRTSPGAQPSCVAKACSAAGPENAVPQCKEYFKKDDRPVACTMEYAPVCGKPESCLRGNSTSSGWAKECETGKTYGNKCSMNAEGAQFMHMGECREGIISCPTYQMPRCGEGEEVIKGEKMANGCYGAPYCKKKEQPVACTREYVPVCGKPKFCMMIDRGASSYSQECESGKTYGNKCTMYAEGAQYMHMGACKTDTVSCPIYNMPRCTTGTAVSGGVGSDGCALPPRCPGEVTKCGVNTFSVKGSRCDGGYPEGTTSGASASVALIAPNPDREASYTAAYFQCYDGYSETMGESSSCKPVSVWQKYAQEKCSARCNVIPVSGSSQGGSPYESFMWVVNSMRQFAQ